jgi:TRAF3-interacting protein 1
MKYAHFITVQIELIRQSIQLLCKSTQPLGKMVDYIQEDIDGMSKELLFWRKESFKYEKALKEDIASFSSNRDDKHQKLDAIIEEQV